MDLGEGVTTPSDCFARPAPSSSDPLSQDRKKLTRFGRWRSAGPAGHSKPSPRRSGRLESNGLSDLSTLDEANVCALDGHEIPFTHISIVMELNLPWSMYVRLQDLAEGVLAGPFTKDRPIRMR